MTTALSRLRAQVAPYKDAIMAARKRGATWGDIGVLIGMSARQARLAVKHCKYPADQIPLPISKPLSATSASNKGNTGTTTPRATMGGFKDITPSN